jgi:hypothetical protein
MNEKIKSMFFTALVIGVLCAGTVSARQLRTNTNALGACSGGCHIRMPCRVINCICVIPPGALMGNCVASQPPAK